MGNPEILASRFPIGSDQVQPPENRVLWVVYQLRQYGEKLPREQVLRTGKTGMLEMLPMDTGLRVRLLRPDGECVDGLWDAKVVRFDQRGLLLHGRTVKAEPQGWWCLVDSATPRDSAGAVS